MKVKNSTDNSRSSISLRGIYGESLKFPQKCSSDHSGTKDPLFGTGKGVKANLTKEDIQIPEIDVVLQETADYLSERLQGKNIFLVGMMGCGKSTVGRILSDALGYGFFDSDTMIEKSAGTSVASIFQEQGEEAFRDLESQAVLQLSSMEGLIVATGGGVVLRDENWKSMSTGISLWIDVPLKDLAQRVVSAGLKSRPILCEGSSGENDLYSQALAKLSSVFTKRENLYLKSDVQVSLGAIASQMGIQVYDLQPKVIASQILLTLKERFDKVAEIESAPAFVSSGFQPIRDVPLGLDHSAMDIESFQKLVPSTH